MDEKGDSWKITKDLNEKSVDIIDNTIWIYLIIPFILVVALLSILYILIKKDA